MEAASRCRDLYPLPRACAVPLRPGSGLSRGTRQRIERRCRQQGTVNEVIETFNDIFAARENSVDTAATAGQSSTRATLSQRRAVQVIEQAVASCGVAPPLHKNYEAARELLGERLDYSGIGAGNNVVPYDRELVSIPSVGSCAPTVASPLGPSAAVVRHYDSAMLLSPDEWEAVLETQPPIAPYMDETLRKNSKKYIEFVHDLYTANVIDFTDVPKDIVTPFFVGKRGKRKIRLVLDCRVPNRRFRRSPQASMGSGATWSRVSLERSESFYIGQSDIQDCFYNMELETELGLFFSLPPVPSKLLEEWGVPVGRGGVLSVNGLVWPYMRRVPMGWSWAFWLVQNAHSYQAMIATDLDKSRFVTDDSPIPSLQSGEPIILAYCDNLNVAGVDKSKVDAVLTTIIKHLTSVGLPVHEIEMGSTSAKSLGYVLDGSSASGNVRPAPPRLQLLLGTARWLSTRPRVSVKTVECFIGNFIHMALLNRGLLSLLRGLYDFTSAGFLGKKRLWPSAARECKWISNLGPFFKADWRLPWSPTVVVSDACLSGIGVCYSRWDAAVVKRVGEISERWRYRATTESTKARSHALKGADPFEDVRTVRAVEAPTSDDAERFELNRDFPEVPLELLGGDWKCSHAFPVRKAEHVSLLEARGVISGVRHKLRSIDNFHCRHLCLGDNLGVELMLTKGRASTFPMLLCCRRLFCLTAVSGSVCYHRWVASELNQADGASRRWELPLAGSRRKRDPCPHPSDGATGAVPSKCSTGGARASRATVVAPDLWPLGRAEEERDYSIPQGDEAREAHGDSARRSPLHGIDGSQCPSGGEVCRVDAAVRRLCPSEEALSEHRPRGRLGLSAAHGRPLQRGLREGRRVHALGCVDGSPPALQPPWGPHATARAAMSGGFQEDGPAANKVADHLGHLVSHCIYDHHGFQVGRVSATRDSALPPADVRGLFASRRGDEDSGGRHCGTAARSTARGVEPPPRRARRELKDWVVRRIAPPGLALRSPRWASCARDGSGASGQSPLFLQLQRPQGRVRKSAGTAKAPREVCVVSVPPRRPLARPSVRDPQPSRSQTTRAMDGGRLGEALRGARTSTTSCQPPLEPIAEGISECSRSLGGAAPRVFGPHASRRDAGRNIIELFSGTAGISRALAALGWKSEAWDRADNKHNDFTRIDILEQLASRIARRHFHAVFVGLPCNTWSRARKNDGQGPPPLRSDSNVYGLSGLGHADAAKVIEANLLLRHVARLLSLCCVLGIPWILENPDTSRVFLTEEIRCLVEQGAVFTVTDMCQFGTPWKKRTKFLCFKVALGELPLCSGERGRCNLSKRPHIILSGRHPCGAHRTAIATPYPSPLCKWLSSCIHDACQNTT